MPVINYMSSPLAYKSLVTDILRQGDRVAPRGLMTYELRNVVLVYPNPYNAPPLGVRPGMSTKIGVVETMQLIGGYSWLGQLDAASNNAFSRYAERGMLGGAYGPRLRDQLASVIDVLTMDPLSRQATATIWRPNELYRLQRHTKDMPCTVSLSWQLRDQALHQTVHMRSNDVWLGLPYDSWAFSRLQHAMATALGVAVGSYVHIADSMHLYQSNVQAVEDMLCVTAQPASVPWVDMAVPSVSAPRPHEYWQLIRENVRAIGMYESDSYAWYGEVLSTLDVDARAYEIYDCCHYVVKANMECACDD